MKVIFHFSDTDCVEVEGYKELNLLAHAQLVERSLQSRCGGHCECSTCRIRVRSGKVSAIRPEEAQLLKKVGINDPNLRLSCQTFPESELVEIEVPNREFKDVRKTE